MADIPDTWRELSGEGKGTLETFCLMILGQAPPYRLVIRVGDPDQGVGYEFRKANR